VRGKTSSALNAKEKRRCKEKNVFEYRWILGHGRVMIFFSLKMVKYLTCEPKLEHMMIVVRVW
jgi:hypothetical protein